MKLKKKVMAAVLASAVSMSLIVPSFAIDLPMTYVENGYYTSDSEASDAFIQYVDSCMADIDHTIVVNNAGDDVTADSLPVIQDLYANNDYTGIREYMSSMHYSLGSITERAQTRAFASRNVDCNFYHCEEDSRYQLGKEWLTTVTGTYTYDVNTYNITHADNPSIRLNSNTNFGYYFSPYMDEVTTKSLISGGKGIVSFSGTYKMLARVDYVFTGQNNVSAIITIPVGATLDFGTFTDSFAIYAEEEPEDRVP